MLVVLSCCSGPVAKKRSANRDRETDLQPHVFASPIHCLPLPPMFHSPNPLVGAAAAFAGTADDVELNASDLEDGSPVKPKLVVTSQGGATASAPTPPSVAHPPKSWKEVAAEKKAAEDARKATEAAAKGREPPRAT